MWSGQIGSRPEMHVCGPGATSTAAAAYAPRQQVTVPVRYCSRERVDARSRAAGVLVCWYYRFGTMYVILYWKLAAIPSHSSRPAM
jgi:hypothetical protein